MCPGGGGDGEGRQQSDHSDQQRDQSAPPEDRETSSSSGGTPKGRKGDKKRAAAKEESSSETEAGAASMSSNQPVSTQLGSTPTIYFGDFHHDTELNFLKAASTAERAREKAKMTTRPRRDSTSSLAAAIQAKAQKDSIGK